MNSCKLFQELATATFDRVLLGHRYNCSQGETTITDINALEIVRAKLGDITIHKAIGTEEARFGFDWEWWIGDDRSGWFRFSVQAKKLSLAQNCYNTLRKRVGTVWQIDVLESFARSQQSIPLYCFYNWVNNSIAKAHWHCNVPLQPDQLGCTLVPLHVVRPVHDKRVKKGFESLHSATESLPWRCLMCCPMLKGRAAHQHPLAHPDIRPLLYEKLPPFLRDLDGAWSITHSEELPPEFYSSDHHGFPRHIMVVRRTSDA